MPQFYRNSDERAPAYALRSAEQPKCLFFAEGQTEALFLEVWLTEEGADPKEIAVLAYRGGTKLPLLLRNLSEDENFSDVERFGFFLDAEAGTVAAKAASVTSALRQANVVPAGHNVQAGVLSSIGGKRIALFVSPNNTNSGLVEDVVMNEITAHALGPCVNNFRTCAAGVLGAPVGAKALVQAFLGIRKPGLCGTGRGFENKILNVMHAAYNDVRTTLGPLL